MLLCSQKLKIQILKICHLEGALRKEQSTE